MTDRAQRPEERVAELLRAGRPAPRVHAALPARLQRRPAPAHRHRARAGAEPAAGRRRRAGLGARRLGPGPDPEPAAGSSAGARADLPLRRPRPQRRRAHQRPRRGDVCRQDRRDGADRDALQRSRKHPYTEALLSAVPKPDPRVRSGSASSCRARSPTRPTRRPAATSTRAAATPSRSAQARRRRCEEIAPGHFVRCHRARELALPGIGAAHGRAAAGSARPTRRGPRPAS